MNVINMTPHDVNILSESNEVIKTYKPHGKIIRVGMSRNELQPIDGVPTWHVNPSGEVFVCEHERGVPVDGSNESLPVTREGTMYIVSLVTALQCPRSDFLIVHDLVRDENNRVVGCRGFSRIADNV